MLRTDVLFEPSDAAVLASLKAALTSTYATGLTVAPKRPKTMTRRVVTLRNDGGVQDRQAYRAYGVNIWADTLVDAFRIAVVCQTDLRMLAGTAPISRTDRFTEPVEIDEDEQFTVTLSGTVTNLAHVYFTFRARIKGRKP